MSVDFSSDGHKGRPPECVTEGKGEEREERESKKKGVTANCRTIDVSRQSSDVLHLLVAVSGSTAPSQLRHSALGTSRLTTMRYMRQLMSVMTNSRGWPVFD